MRIVFDTDVLVAAFCSNQGASRALLLAALDRELTLSASVPLWLEYEAVITRPDHLAASGLSAQEVSDVLDAMAAVAEPVRLSFLWRPQVRDAADEMVLATAVNGVADCLVTFNQRHLSAAAIRFGIQALRPGELYRSIYGRTDATK